MFSAEHNGRLCQVGPDTPMGASTVIEAPTTWQDLVPGSPGQADLTRVS